ncbi:hypothetical protein [Chitinivorax sp. B]|uniref:hypothetical protein n=1 Tax=Chitinivorax sp. B TaxID=2502235 RepID=UPI00148516C7|nr:hypothetical protein [Chitinivorax sp. B]
MVQKRKPVEKNNTLAESTETPHTVGDISFSGSTVRDFSQMAEFPYKNHDTAHVPQGWQIVTDGTATAIATQLQQHGMGKVRGADQVGYVGLASQGANAFLLGRKDQQGEWQEIAIAFGGTNSTGPSGELHRFKQWTMHNAGNFVGFVPSNLTFADRLTKEVQAHFGDQVKVMTVGHSKGGLEAEYAAKCNGLDGISFNAAKAGIGTRRRADFQAKQLPPTQSQGTILGLRNSFDLVSNAKPGQSLATEQILLRSPTHDDMDLNKVTRQVEAHSQPTPGMMSAAAVLNSIANTKDSVMLGIKDHVDFDSIRNMPLDTGPNRKVRGDGPILRDSMSKVAAHKAKQTQPTPPTRTQGRSR